MFMDPIIQGGAEARLGLGPPLEAHLVTGLQKLVVRTWAGFRAFFGLPPGEFPCPGKDLPPGATGWHLPPPAFGVYGLPRA